MPPKRANSGAAGRKAKRTRREESDVEEGGSQADSPSSTQRAVFDEYFKKKATKDKANSQAFQNQFSSLVKEFDDKIKKRLDGYFKEFDARVAEMKPLFTPTSLNLKADEQLEFHETTTTTLQTSLKPLRNNLNTNKDDLWAQVLDIMDHRKEAISSKTREMAIVIQSSIANHQKETATITDARRFKRHLHKLMST